MKGTLSNLILVAFLIATTCTIASAKDSVDAVPRLISYEHRPPSPSLQTDVERIWKRLCNEQAAQPTIVHETRHRLLLMEWCSSGQRYLGRVDLNPEPRVAWTFEVPKQPDVDLHGLKLGPDFINFEGAGVGGFVLRSWVLNKYAVVNEDGSFQWLGKFQPYLWDKGSVAMPRSGVATMAGNEIYRVEHASLNVIRMDMHSGTKQIIGALPDGWFVTPRTYALRFVDSHNQFLVALTNASSRVHVDSRVTLYDTKTGKTVAQKSYKSSLPEASIFNVDRDGCLHIVTTLNSGKIVDDVVRPCSLN